ncbi:phage tail protein [Streptacidiphilus sp. 4-A2]|nr:phage tail protein [Streptacidiphilus sp. 4-A2]
MSTPQDPGSTIFFTLSIDGEDLGSFNACEGLAAEVEVEAYTEGGNGFVWQLPSRVKHSTIKLTRPLTADTAKVAAWISSVATNNVVRPTAQISALRADGSLVAQWGLLDVLPVRWTGPSLDPMSPNVATEALEITHHGFTQAGA